MNGQPPVITPSVEDIKQILTANQDRTGLCSDLETLLAKTLEPTRYWWWIREPSTEEYKTYLFTPHDIAELEGISPHRHVKFTEEQLHTRFHIILKPSWPKSMCTLYQSILKNLHEMLQICKAKGWMDTSLDGSPYLVNKEKLL